jgi:hypothetical protein
VDVLFRTGESQPHSLFTVSAVFHFQFSEHFLGFCCLITEHPMMAFQLGLACWCGIEGCGSRIFESRMIEVSCFSPLDLIPQP